MSKIEIRKISITKLDTDCIVNAANEQLIEGSGVCGAIFSEAGASDLQRACNAYGGCRTGSAVITPGFHLKAKYIIHAVGPVWNGGKAGEEQKLYSCYQASMKLAEENGCHSIAFPLISSGIFGYPKDAAWRVAIRAVRDYQEKHRDCPLDVIFAVLSDEIFEIGQNALSETEQERKAQGFFFHIVRFHRPEEENGYLSNWYMSDFVVDGKTYCCAEQYMMEQKALIFQDPASAEKIMNTRDQQEMQDLGRAVKNFIPEIWDGRKQLVVYKAVLEKFRQNPELLGRLVTTGTATPVECAKTDKVWGIGMGMDDPDAANPRKWRGKNLLGFTIQAVRIELMRKLTEDRNSR